MAQHAAPARTPRRTTSIGRSAARSGQRRRDIQGLRAVAVLAVVAFHAGVPRLSGGYVGVDVFFVISGYLITGLLWREVSSTGRLSLGRFYARRARRLLPAAVLVLVATVMASAYWLPPLRLRSVLSDALAATFYVGNYRLAVQGTDYLASTAPPSPLQHYWSLGVEEQFYLLWPLLVILSAVLAGRRGALLALGVLTGASFLLNLRWTSDLPSWAYFSLPTRAWELGVGALLALLEPELRRRSARLLSALGWLGLAAILVGCTVFGATTAFPGTAALYPVLGAGAVLVAGMTGSPAGPGRLLGLGPLQALGRWSYSWYLWHWPVLLLAPAALGHALGLGGRLLAALLSLLLAVLSYALVENPIHRSPARAVRGNRGLLLAAGLTATSVLSLAVIAALIPVPAGHGTAGAPVAISTQLRSALPTRSAAVTPPSPLETLTQQVQSALVQADAARQVPANLSPSLSDAAGDKSAPFVDGCLSSWTADEPSNCFYGDQQDRSTVLLLGDSHAAQWQPALLSVAAKQRFRLQVLGKSACPPLPLPVFSPYLGRTYTECSSWLSQSLADVRTVHPQLVVLDVARHYGNDYNFTVYSKQWDGALASVVRSIRAAGSPVLVLGPIPKPPSDVPTCLSAHIGDATKCLIPQAPALSRSGELGEQAAVAGAGGSYLDLAPFVCARGECPTMVGRDLVYRDDNHLTTTFVSWLTPLFELEVGQLRRPVPSH